MIVSIVIPVYNEALLLPMVLERVAAAPLPSGCEKEIIVVDDGSTDSTRAVLERYRESHYVVVHHSPVNFGKGAAIRLALARLSGDIILIQDGDLEYDPRDYPAVLAPSSPAPRTSCSDPGSCRACAECGNATGSPTRF